MTSLFSRLQKLNKQATKEPWNWIPGDEGHGFRFGGEHWMDEAGYARDDVDADLIVECRNSLPAVLNLIEAAQRVAILEYDARKTDAQNDELQRRGRAFREAVAVFVSGQEEPK